MDLPVQELALPVTSLQTPNHAGIVFLSQQKTDICRRQLSSVLLFSALIADAGTQMLCHR